MPLYLKVISYRGHPPVAPIETSFDEDGGSLGRSSAKRSNHLTLPDPEQYISRKHALISFENGHYTLMDTSKDGTYIENKNTRICNETVILSDGDRLRIGDYELIVQIPSQDATNSVRNGVFNSIEDDGLASFFDSGDGPSNTADGNQSRHGEDNLWWSDEDVSAKQPDPDLTPGQPEASPLHDAFTPPDIVDNADQPQEIPQDFNFQELIGDLDAPHDDRPGKDIFAQEQRGSTIEPEAPQKPLESYPSPSRFDSPNANQQVPDNAMAYPKKAPEKSFALESTDNEKIRRQAERDLFQIFLDAAGVNDSNLLQSEGIPERMRTIGAVFREMVQGLMTVLQGRTEIKTQLQVPVTTIKPAKNNPLKFFKIVDETIQQLLTGDRPGFVDAIDAVHEGYADVMNHQLAITAAIQAAVIGLIDRFDPQHIAKHFDEGVVFQKKAKSWDTYQRAYTEIADEALENFFGESFARAYEEQIRQLRSKINDHESDQGITRNGNEK